MQDCGPWILDDVGHAFDRTSVPIFVVKHHNSKSISFIVYVVFSLIAR